MTLLYILYIYGYALFPVVFLCGMSRTLLGSKGAFGKKLYKFRERAQLRIKSISLTEPLRQNLQNRREFSVNKSCQIPFTKFVKHYIYINCQRETEITSKIPRLELNFIKKRFG